MVSPGTHLMKNHETMSITNESLLKTTRGHKLKVLEPLCNQTVDLETDDKTLCCSLLKTNTVDRPYIDSCLNLSTQKPCSVPKAKVADMERFNCMHTTSNNSHKNHTNRTFYQKIFQSINGSLRPTGHIS